MKIKIEYHTDEEKVTILNENKHLLLIEHHNLTEGNFLIFSDAELRPPIVYVTVPEEEFENIREQNTDLMLAIAEMAEADALEKTEMQLAIAELAEIISGGAV